MHIYNTIQYKAILYVHLYPRITRKRSDRYEQSCFWHNVSSDRIASNALWTHRISSDSSDRIASTAVLTRFQFAVFRFGIVMTANLAAHQEPLGRSFCRERLAHGTLRHGMVQIRTDVFEWSIGLEASIFNHSTLTNEERFTAIVSQSLVFVLVQVKRRQYTQQYIAGKHYNI